MQPKGVLSCSSNRKRSQSQYDQAGDKRYMKPYKIIGLAPMFFVFKTQFIFSLTEIFDGFLHYSMVLVTNLRHSLDLSHRVGPVCCSRSKLLTPKDEDHHWSYKHSQCNHRHTNEQILNAQSR